jgi:hypothetical protein
MFSTCHVCGETWPCTTNVAERAPVVITGIWLTDGDTDDELVVYVEMDGEWRQAIRTRHQPGMLLSHIVEPLGIRNGPMRLR